ncbi:MAG: Holliday junction branch migration protein RuvA [Planctomycetes bacterium]|nr:Holliday junction branch migration protein RuvA [Planctomycetota bacterium]
MYNHIHGVVVQKSPSRLVLEAGGVGYELIIPLSAFRRFPEPGTETTALVHLVVRENEMRLIGFADAEERELFRRLIELSGVGPSMALQILSGMSPREFALAVERQDAEALRKIKGVGEKTAKRIILELKGAKTVLPADESGYPAAGTAGEAITALTTLGLSQSEATVRVEKALRQQPDLAVEELIKAALR